MLITCRTCLLEQELPQGLDLLICPACGTNNCRPQAQGESLVKLHRANRLLHAHEFAEAESCFRHVLVDFDDEHEALWGKLLCQYGVEIVCDPVSKKRHPVVHIPRMRPMQETADFRQACDLAPEEIRRQYEEDAAYIDDAQAEIRRLAEDCPPYDVFLCHKTTHADGQGYTEDYRRANKLYYELKSRGFRVFFAPEEMEGVSAGANYEAHIFHALHTAQVMLVICSDPANLASTWVRSEWQRYLELTDAQQGHLVPLLYGEMPASKLPQPFRRRKLEGIRMGEMGAMERTLQTVERYCGKKEQPKPAPVPQPELPRSEPKPEPAKPELKPEPIKPVPESTAAMKYIFEEVIGGVAINRYKGESAKVVIPEFLDGKKVVEIGNCAFQCCENLTTVVLPEGVTSIGFKAFAGCKKLTSITIPSTVTSIKLLAFSHCSSLTRITIPDSVTRIERWAFYKCTNLAEVTFPTTMPILSKDAFDGCPLPLSTRTKILFAPKL